MTHYAATERRILSLLRDQYELDGFTFIEHPSSDMLPKAFGTYRPDAIALGDNEKYAIEVKSGRTSPPGVRDVSGVVSSVEGWKIRIVYPGDAPEGDPGGQAPLVDFSGKSGEVRALLDGGHSIAAVLFAWSVLEAAMLARLKSQYGIDVSAPKSAAGLIAKLETLGEITSEEARRLGKLASVRNGLAHGYHGTVPPDEEIAELSDLIERLAPRGELEPSQ